MYQTGCGVMAIAAALGVSVLGAPRAGDEAARGRGKGGTEVTHLVAGDPTQFNAVIAGTPPTAILAVNPVNPPSGVPAYPVGTTIVGNELRAPTGGFRAWFNVQVSNWDPLGNGPNLSLYQVKIDCTNYWGEYAVPPNVGVDLAPASVACPGGDPTPCVTAFGEDWALCNGNGDGMCDAGYLDLAPGRPDSWCAPSGGRCNTGGVAISTCNYNFFAISDSVLGHPDQSNTCVGGARNGQGCRPANATANCGAGSTCTGPKLPSYYGGTLVLDLPIGANGKYTVFLNSDETFVAAPGTPPIVLESLEENGFVVNFVNGACCSPHRPHTCEDTVPEALCHDNFGYYGGDGSTCAMTDCDRCDDPVCESCWIGTLREDDCDAAWNGDGECDCGCQFQDSDCSSTKVLKWESVITHTRSGVTPLDVPLNIPNDNTFSEPRSGIKKLVVTFDGPLNPATVIPANVTICGNNSAGSPVNLSGVVVTTATTSGDTKMEINFAPALPNFARYRIALETGILGADGGPIAGTGGLSRILTALQGDSSGDRRVNATDVGGIRSLVPRDPIDPAVLAQVRGDVNNDKRINATDVGGARSLAGNDARTIPDPVCP